MALQNRVAPTGEIVKSSERGTLMGNRGGAMHNAHKELVSVSKTKRWITCRLEFKGRKRELMSEGLYTELFFLDEATAFAAGHRPCAECRRERFNEFKTKWLEVNSDLLDGKYTGIGDIDKVMHVERIDKQKKVTFKAPCNTLPDGTMISMGDASYLVWKNRLYLWSFAGYALSDAEISNERVTVLTPKSYVEMFMHGFKPVVHESLKEL